MKYLLFFSLIVFSSSILLAQKNSFGLLKFKITDGWQEQTKQQVISFSGMESEINIPVEIRVYQNQPAGIKPDSSFRIEWQRILKDYGNPPLPYAKKRYASSGLQVAINQATPSEIIENNQKKYTQLAVFIIEKQMQTIQFIAYNASDFKLLRPFIDDFIEAVDTIAKRD
ncbi:hypothetical protein BH10BAC3_BH10BAC3_06180 [soil metagenome]